MKKILLALTMIILMAALVACSSGGAPAGNQNAAVDGTFGEADLVFELNGVKYPLKTDAAPLLAALGEYESMEAAPSCRYEGEDKIFYYSFGYICTYPMDGKDMLDEIYFNDGDYKTAKGIGIGSTLDEVKAKYGDKGFEQDDMYVYVLSGDKNDLKSPKLYFELQGEVVSGISYYGASNVAE